MLVAGFAAGTFDKGAIDTGKNLQGVVMKLDPTGKVLWERAIPGTTINVSDIALDASGNAIVVGGFQGTIDVGKGVVNAEGPSSTCSRCSCRPRTAPRSGAAPGATRPRTSPSRSRSRQPTATS